MRTTSKKKQKSKSFFQQEKFRAELSSGQLVIGISILILFGLTCFLLGILLGRSEHARTVEVASLAQPESLEPAGQSDELPINLGNVPPTIHRLPAPQPSESLPLSEPDIPSSLENKAASPIPPIESTSPVKDLVTTLESATSSTLAVPPEPIVPDASKTTVTEASESLVTSSDLEIANAPYSVQVGAFSKRANAESAKKKIQSNTSYPVQLLEVPERNVTIVLAGAFQDRSAAETARTILRDKLGYTDSYIKKNSK